MNLRFAVALQAVVIAAMGISASAMAPTISDLPEVVIADDALGSHVSGANHFVYPNAINLDENVFDDTASDDQILWSYWSATGRYQINGKDTIDLGTEDPVNPGAKRIDDADDDPDSGDTDGNTITLRDSTLSPIGGPDTDPGAAGIVASEIVTLFASDGTTYSQKEFVAYTDNDGTDRLSEQQGPVLTPEKSIIAAAGDFALWTSGTQIGGTGFIKDTVNGVCLTLPLTGVNMGTWTSPENILQLGQNKVYRIRLDVDATANLPVGTTPLWDFYVDNFGATGDNRFSGDMFVLDTEGGANSAGLDSGGRNQFDLWFAPPAISAADWNDQTNGVFTTARVSQNKNGMRFTFRSIDANDAIQTDNDAGTICLRSVTVDSVDLDDLEASKTLVFDGSNIANNTFVTDVLVYSPANTSVVYGGGSVTINPTAGNADAWDEALIQLSPGDTSNDFGQPNSLDNYPVVWTSDELLMSVTTVAASSATSVTNPPDALGFVIEPNTSEYGWQANAAATVDTIGMPKLTPTDYKAFFYTHSASATTATSGGRIRPRLIIINNTAIGQSGIVNNAGGVVVSDMSVYKLDLP